MARSGGVDATPDVAGRRERLLALCRALPQAQVEVAGARHLAFKVAKKIFGYYLYDHHGDGRIAVNFKAPPGEQARLVAKDPAVYFVPPYVGPKGWVGMRLDRRRVDWPALEALVFGAYFMTAPDKLRKQLDGVTSGEVPKRHRR
jgi:hypothetical protein